MRKPFVSLGITLRANLSRHFFLLCRALEKGRLCLDLESAELSWEPGSQFQPRVATSGPPGDAAKRVSLEVREGNRNEHLCDESVT